MRSDADPKSRLFQSEEQDGTAAPKQEPEGNGPRPFLSASGNASRPAGSPATAPGQPPAAPAGAPPAGSPFGRTGLGIPGTRAGSDPAPRVGINSDLLKPGKPAGLDDLAAKKQKRAEAAAEKQPLELAELLRTMIDLGASDLHLTPGVPPQVRVDGDLQPLPYPNLDPRTSQALLYSVMTDDQRAKFEGNLELDFSFGLKDLARFRGNIFYQRGAISGALRLIPWRIPSFDELGLPEVIAGICDRPRGLILVTGPTGSGKSTTLAAMIDLINENKPHHIITIEDPIEYLHKHKKSIVNQRELHADTHSFANALRSAMREDPDSVLIGEMRDLESTELALKLAETGHLTFGTLHTNGAVQTINRVIDIFPTGQQSQIRTQLSFVLQAVISQTLLPHTSGKGRVLVQEILIPNAAIRNLIREDKVHQVYSSMQSGQAEHGMKTFNQDLARLVTERKISAETAMNSSPDHAELATMLDRLEGAMRGRTKLDREIAGRAAKQGRAPRRSMGGR
jgi:twitching motility protein PilT